MNLDIKLGCRSVLGVLGAILALTCASTISLAQQPAPSGFVVVDETQVAFIFSGQSGGGTLRFAGQVYPFTIGGIGVGGFGVSQIKATGEVYDLKNVAEFFGPYGEARTGWAVGQAGSGQLWLQNPNGVVLHLKGEREGLMLTMGADVVNVSPR